MSGGTLPVQAGGGDLLARLLAATTLRAEVIANNLANQNTPGFQRQVVRFEELLRGVLAESRSDSQRAAAVLPRIEADRLTPPGADGNNVHMELEMNALRQNQLLYDAYAGILATRFEVMRAAIESGR